MLLPAPNPDEESLTELENEGSDDDYGPDFTQEDADSAYRDWLVTMDEDKKHEEYRSSQLLFKGITQFDSISFQGLGEWCSFQL